MSARPGRARSVTDAAPPAFSRLHLALHPLLPVRAPHTAGPRAVFGYSLRLPGGPRLMADDALLEAFGASVDWLEADDDDLVLQDEAFAPGRRLRLAVEPHPVGEEDEVSVLDARGALRAGSLPDLAAARVAAAFDHGLAMAAIALSEERSHGIDRRARISLLVFSPSLVEVDDAPPPLLSRTPRATRARVVLFADGRGELRWWDASGDTGPVEVDALPVSDELAADFEQLREQFGALAGDDDADPELAFERGWARGALDEEARSLWVRARRELGRRYAVGFLGRGMDRPVWTPTPPSDDDPF